MLSQLLGKMAPTPFYLKVQAPHEQAYPPSARTAKWPLYLENPMAMQDGNYGSVGDQKSVLTHI
jgi:hypothetical protein